MRYVVEVKHTIEYLMDVEADSLGHARKILLSLAKREKAQDDCDLRDTVYDRGYVVSDRMTVGKIYVVSDREALKR